MYFSIDRIEDGVAILVGDDGGALEIEASLLPTGTAETDVLLYSGGAFFPAPEETQKRREEAAALLAALLFPGGEQKGESTEEKGQQGDAHANGNGHS